MNLVRALLDTLLPPHDDARIAASITASDLAALAVPRTVRGTFAVFPYQNRTIRAMVRAIKYYGETSVLEPLGACAAEHLVGILEDEDLEKRKTLMTPIPSSPARLRKRGYNQAERIARAIYAHLPTGFPVEYIPNLLAREDRETQVHAHKTRADNIRGAFYTPENAMIYHSVRGSRIILIDDVVKTGATIRDATRALKAAGAKSVIAFAIAH
jgi:predicted amidophosphoribosyltransferase